MSSLPWTEALLRLTAAMVLSAALGWNREKARKPAGIRTHLLVGIGSALIMIISIELYQKYAGSSLRGDPGRIAAQVVSGIGFIGAGTILQSKGLVIGLTTAASVWAVAGIGLACGAGFFELAGLATALILAALYVINRFIRSESEGWDRDRKKD